MKEQIVIKLIKLMMVIKGSQVKNKVLLKTAFPGLFCPGKAPGKSRSFSEITGFPPRREAFKIHFPIC